MKRDLLGFHQWLLNEDDNKNTDLNFDDVDFRRSYAEKIFSLGSSGLQAIWQLFLEHFTAADQARVALFSAFLAHAKLFDGRHPNKLLETATASGTLEPLLQQTATLIANFSPLKEGHLLSLYYRLLGLKMLLAKISNQTLSTSTESFNHHHLFDLSDVFEQTNSGQWTELYELFDHLPSDVQLTFVQLMITKYRYLKTVEVEVETSALEELVAMLVESKSEALVRVDVFTAVLPALTKSHHSMATALEYLLQLFTSSADDDNQFCRRIVAILADADLWELGGLRFQAAYITALVKAMIRTMSSKSGKKRKSPDDDALGNDGSQNSDSSLQVLEILASKENLWAKESRTTLTSDSSTSKENKIPALLRSASAAFLEMIQNNNNSSSSKKSGKSNPTTTLRLLDLLLATVPLEHLKPVGQLRTILLLSTLLVANSSSKTYDEGGRRKLATAFVTANRRIWASVRSVWLFDYLPPAEYIISVLVSLLRCASSSELPSTTTTTTTSGHLDSACYSLFNDCLIANVFQLYDLPRSERNVASLVEALNGSGKEGAQQHGVENLEYVLVMLQTMLLRANAAFLRKLSNRGGGVKKFDDAHREAFEAIGAQVGAAIYRNIKIYLEGTASTSSSLQSSEFVVEGLTRLFEFKVFAEVNVSAEEAKLKSKWRKLLTRFIAISLENIGAGGSVSEDDLKAVECRNDPQQKRQQHFVNFLRVVVLNRARLHGYSLPADFVAELWAKMTGEDSDADLAEESTEEEVQNLLQEKLSSTTHWRRLFTSRKSLRKFRRLLEHSSESGHQQSALEQQLAAYDRRLATFRPLYGPLAASATAEEWATVLLPSVALMLSGNAASSSSSLARSLFAIRVLLELIGGENSGGGESKAEKTKDLEVAEKSRLLAEHYHVLLSGLINVNLVAGKAVGETKSNLNLLGRVRTDSVLLARALLFRLTAAGLLSNAHLFLAFNLAAECSPLGLLPPSSSSVKANSTTASDSASTTTTTTNFHHHSNDLLTTFTALFSAHNGLLQGLLSRRPHLLLYSMGGGSHGTLLVGMLTALMRAADEREEGAAAGLMAARANSTDAEKLALEQCSAAFAQTVAGLCRAPAGEEFRPFAEHLLAAYLHQAPEHSVAPFVRKHLTAIAFSLIDLLQVSGGGGGGDSKKRTTKKESTLERLYSAVGSGPRELLGRLLEQYDKYHRFKGYV